MSRLSARKRQIRDAQLLGAIMLVLAAIFYIKGGVIIRGIVLIAVGLTLAMFLVIGIIKFLNTSLGAKTAFAWNELLYSLVGVPIMFIAIFYLPVAIYFLFFKHQFPSHIIRNVLLGLMIFAQIISLVLFFKQIFEDRSVKESPIKKKEKKDFSTLYDDM